MTDKTVKKIEIQKKRRGKQKAQFQAIELQSLEEGSKKYIYICDQFTAQTVDALYAQEILKEEDPAPAATIFANGQRTGGHGPRARGQEEGTLNDSDLPTHMPSAYPQNDIYNLGGVMGVTGAKTNAGNAFNATFISMPYFVPAYDEKKKQINPSLNMTSNSKEEDQIYTSPEKDYFLNSENKSDHDAYFKHLIGLTMLEFAMAKAMGASVVIGGLKGCGAFQNPPLIVAAVYCAVAQRPEFKEMTLVLALKTQKDHKCFKRYSADSKKSNNLTTVFNLLTEHFESNISPDTLSTHVSEFFVSLRNECNAKQERQEQERLEQERLEQEQAKLTKEEEIESSYTSSSEEEEQDKEQHQEQEQEQDLNQA